MEETGTVDSMEASDPAASRVVSSWVFRVWWHQMEEVGVAAVSVVLVEFAAGLVVAQPETVAVQVALVLVETAEEVCPVEHGEVEVEDGAVVESTGDAARWVICFETGVLAEAEVAGHGATILTVHGAGAEVLETYSFENRQPWEEDWSEVFPRVHLHEVAMVQVEEVAVAVLNPVAAYLPLLFWLSTLPNYSGPYLPLFHRCHIFPSSYLQDLRDWQRSPSCLSVPFGFEISTALENP